MRYQTRNVSGFPGFPTLNFTRIRCDFPFFRWISNWAAKRAGGHFRDWFRPFEKAEENRNVLSTDVERADRVRGRFAFGCRRDHGPEVEKPNFESGHIFRSNFVYGNENRLRPVNDKRKYRGRDGHNP